MRAADIYNILKINKAFPVAYTVDKRWFFAGRSWHLEVRSKNNLWGRFGGGWNWHIGAQWGESTIIWYLLIGMLRVSKMTREEHEKRYCTKEESHD